MAATTPAPRIRNARLALFAVFGLNGMLSAVWIVHIPAVTGRASVSPTTLGMLILLMAACAIIGMQAAGPLADRLGSRTLTAAAATLLALALLGPAYAASPVTLGLTLCVFGFANGAIDVSMNAQAVHIERAYARPIMSAFHAFFSCGGFLGSAFGAATQHAHWPIHLTFGLSTAFGLATIGAAIPRLLPHAESTVAGAHTADPGPEPAQHFPAISGDTDPIRGDGQSTAPTARDTAAPIAKPIPDAALAPERTTDDPMAQRAGAQPGPARMGGGEHPHAPRPLRPEPIAAEAGADAAPRIGRKVLALGLIAFALLMAEGVAADWSALQVKGRLGVDAGTAALAFTGFSLAMTLGRFGTDRVSGRFGRVAIVRWGTLLAAIGFGLVVTSGRLPLTLLGWTLCGVGLSGGVPQVFTAAGNLGSGTAATDMSRVFGLGYVGLLAGPAIIGWLDKALPLTAAMAVPLLAMLLCAWGAHAVAAPTRASADR
ncbi:MFS transporter [Nocardia aurantiaca]|uniref:MFS transporter n=1 Tax=Nocardia aurantiaca TaxID=2675850 RepID=A0A6I3KTM5_9NOCA|nr:MFS transporter [Nocardia aurantiaca]MTE11785.1 MFS transporter [Nocardia aurantiaca]